MAPENNLTINTNIGSIQEPQSSTSRRRSPRKQTANIANRQEPLQWNLYPNSYFTQPQYFDQTGTGPYALDTIAATSSSLPHVPLEQPVYYHNPVEHYSTNNKPNITQMRNEARIRNVENKSPSSVFSPTLSVKVKTKRMKFKDYLELIEVRRYKDKSLHNEKKRPWVTLAVWVISGSLLIACIIVNGGFAQLSQQPFFGPSPETLITMGGIYPPLIRSDLANNWWRLIVGNFLHAGVVHLLVNVAAMWAVCFRAERFWGHWRMVIILLVTGITGALTCCMYRTKNVVSVGASGMICGVIGALIGDNLKNWRAILKPMVHLIYWLANAIILFLIGIAPVFDNLMHVSSFLAGIFLALFLTPFGDKKMSRIVKVVIALVGLAFIAVYWGVGFHIVSTGQVSNCKACCYMLLAFNC